MNNQPSGSTFLGRLFGTPVSPPPTQALYDMMATLITSTYDLDTLVAGTNEIIRKELNATYVKIVLVDRDQLLFFNSIGHHDQKMLPDDVPHLERLSVHRMAIEQELPEGELKQWMKGFGITVLFKLEVRGTRVGYLFLGSNVRGVPYPKEDIDMLSIVVDQLAVAFTNAISVKRISAFNEELKREVEQATLALQKANEDLKQLDKLKDEFVSMASHELKNPLSAIKNFLWLALKKGNDEPEKVAQYLNTAYKATEQVLFLVNDLLDVSRIESGRITLAQEPVALAPLITEILAVFDMQLKERALEVTVHIEPDVRVNADTARTREVISNFISNAIKYTLKGSITISATSAQGIVTCSIQDTGVGIKPEDQSRLFEKFSRIDSGVKELATVEGTGLGLYITKKLVTLMGGTVGVESAPQKGSRFWFTLPQA